MRFAEARRRIIETKHFFFFYRSTQFDGYLDNVQAFVDYLTGSTFDASIAQSMFLQLLDEASISRNLNKRSSIVGASFGTLEILVSEAEYICIIAID